MFCSRMGALIARMAAFRVLCPAADSSDGEGGAAQGRSEREPPVSVRDALRDYRLDRMEERLKELPGELGDRLDERARSITDWAESMSRRMDRQLSIIGCFFTVIALVASFASFAIGWTWNSEFHKEFEAKVDQLHLQHANATKRLNETYSSLMAMYEKAVWQSREMDRIYASHAEVDKPRILSGEDRKTVEAVAEDESAPPLTRLKARALVALATGRWAEALSLSESIFGIAPNDVETWYNKGYALVKLKRPEEAVAAYDRVIELSPKEAKAWYNKGFALDELGSEKEALAAYERAIELAPDESKAWINKGYELARLGCAEEALTAFERAVELDSKNCKAWSNKGAMHSLLGRHGDALAAFERACDLEPGNASYAAARGYGHALVALESRGEESRDHWRKSEEAFSRAEDLKPGSSAYPRACLAALRGEGEACRKWLATALEHGALPGCRDMKDDPDFDSVRSASWFKDILAVVCKEKTPAGRGTPRQ